MDETICSVHTSPEDSKKFCEFLKSVSFPDGFASNIRKSIMDGNNKITGLKLHHYHVIMQNNWDLTIHEERNCRCHNKIKQFLLVDMFEDIED